MFAIAYTPPVNKYILNNLKQYARAYVPILADDIVEFPNIIVVNELQLRNAYAPIELQDGKLAFANE